MTTKKRIGNRCYLLILIEQNLLDPEHLPNSLALSLDLLSDRFYIVVTTIASSTSTHHHSSYVFRTFFLLLPILSLVFHTPSFFQLLVAPFDAIETPRDRHRVYLLHDPITPRSQLLREIVRSHQDRALYYIEYTPVRSVEEPGPVLQVRRRVLARRHGGGLTARSNQTSSPFVLIRFESDLI